MAHAGLHLLPVPRGQAPPPISPPVLLPHRERTTIPCSSCNAGVRHGSRHVGAGAEFRLTGEGPHGVGDGPAAFQSGDWRVAQALSE